MYLSLGECSSRGSIAPSKADTKSLNSSQNIPASKDQGVHAARKGVKLANVGQTVKWLVAPKPANIFMDKLKTQKNVTWMDLMGTDMMSEHNVYFDLNFNHLILSCFATGKLLEELGYEIPEIIRLGVMRREALRQDVTAVTDMLKNYNGIVQNLTTPQVSAKFQKFFCHLKFNSVK